MSTLGDSSLSDDRDWRPVYLGVAVVLILVGVIAFSLRTPARAPVPKDPYAASVKLSDLKMSQAQNFVGSSVTYVEGNVTNAGAKTVTHAVVHVEFKDSLNQVTQADDLPLHVLQIQTGGAYLDGVDLSVAPLAPGQSKPFRLTFEHVSTDWNQAYPELQITATVVK
jgi:hypothetical protein